MGAKGASLLQRPFGCCACSRTSSTTGGPRSKPAGSDCTRRTGARASDERLRVLRMECGWRGGVFVSSRERREGEGTLGRGVDSSRARADVLWAHATAAGEREVRRGVDKMGGQVLWGRTRKLDKKRGRKDETGGPAASSYPLLCPSRPLSLLHPPTLDTPARPAKPPRPIHEARHIGGKGGQQPSARANASSGRPYKSRLCAAARTSQRPPIRRAAPRRRSTRRLLEQLPGVAMTLPRRQKHSRDRRRDRAESPLFRAASAKSRREACGRTKRGRGGEGAIAIARAPERPPPRPTAAATAAEAPRKNPVLLLPSALSLSLNSNQ